jgi:hypothetical protein
MPEEDDVKRSNVIEMPNRKPKANPTPEELELWRLVLTSAELERSATDIPADRSTESRAPVTTSHLSMKDSSRTSAMSLNRFVHRYPAIDWRARCATPE